MITMIANTYLISFTAFLLINYASCNINAPPGVNPNIYNAVSTATILLSSSSSHTYWNFYFSLGRTWSSSTTCSGTIRSASSTQCSICLSPATSSRATCSSTRAGNSNVLYNKNTLVEMLNLPSLFP